MAHITAYLPEYLYRRYQDVWARREDGVTFSGWLQTELEEELDRCEAASAPRRPSEALEALEGSDLPSPPVPAA